MREALILILNVFIFTFSSSKGQYSNSFSYPLQDNWNVTQDFNIWNGAFNGYHLGEDVVRNSESAVYATADGKVMHVAQHTGYGYVIIIQHQLQDNSYVCSVYGHLRAKDITVSGIDIRKGQLIGYLSSDPNENGGYDFTHLHFGIRSGSYSTNLDSDGKWRYRGYGPTDIVALWYDPTDFVMSRNSEETSSLSWTRITDMPSSRSWTQAVYYDGKIYVVGGCSASVAKQFANEVSKLEVYDISTNTWETKSSMIYSRLGAGVVTYNGKIYVFGGFNQNYWSANNSCEVYDIATDRWSMLPSMPTGRSWTKAVVYNNKIYVLGGVGNFYENVMEVFDPSTNSWLTKKSFSKGRYMHAIAARDNKIYLIGGDSWANGSEVFNDLQIYDIVTDSWLTKKSMPSAATQLEAVVVNDEVWVFGSDGLCRKYNITSDTWTEINSYNQNKTSGFSIAYYNGTFYKFGGGDWGPTSSIAEKTSISTELNSIIINGGFEQGLTNWLYVEFTQGSSVSVKTESNNKYISFKHLSNYDWCSIGQEVRSKLLIGQKYLISYRYKVNTGSNLVLGIRFADNSTVMHSTGIDKDSWSSTLLSDGQWHSKSINFTASSDHPLSTEPMFSFMFDYQNTGEVYLDDLSFAIVTDVENLSDQLINTFVLDQNYPNPFNPTTTIKFSVPNFQFVTLKVYDILGREISTLVNEEKLPGNYEVEFNGSNLSSGIYFYRLSAGAYSQTKKLVLLK